jgi:hypothetical protein
VWLDVYDTTRVTCRENERGEILTGGKVKTRIYGPIWAMVEFGG